MTATQLLHEIKSWPLAEKLHLIELISREIRTETTRGRDDQQEMAAAARLLLQDYQEDKELTAFTALDHEDFHEPK